MNQSQTVTAVFVQLAVIFLPMMGIQIGSDELTVAVQTIVVVLSGLWIWYRRVQAGDIKVFGARKVKYSKD